MDNPNEALKKGSTFFCTMCRVNCSGHTAFHSHLAGEQHKMNEQRCKQPKPAVDGHAVDGQKKLLFEVPSKVSAAPVTLPRNNIRTQQIPTATTQTEILATELPVEAGRKVNILSQHKIPKTTRSSQTAATTATRHLRTNALSKRTAKPAIVHDPVSSEPGNSIQRKDHHNRQRLIPGPLECAICCELMLDPVTLACGHIFCLHCLAGYWQKVNKIVCSMCRHETSCSVTVSSQLRVLIEELFPEANYNRRKAMTQEQGMAAEQFLQLRYKPLDEIKVANAEPRLPLGLFAFILIVGFIFGFCFCKDTYSRL